MLNIHILIFASLRSLTFCKFTIVFAPEATSEDFWFSWVVKFASFKVCSLVKRSSWVRRIDVGGWGDGGREELVGRGGVGVALELVLELES